ncbi:hypothetical protein WJX72_002650 [[Myrmecia] bisecta]|uniref:BZIP domain-containing protein n=1 Tax=[Myrmecia] bisecta TaxID=41462 RepID=A0AAW1PFK4_9CHLO
MRSRKRTEEGSIEWMHTAEQDTDWIKLLLDTPAAAAELDAALLEDGPELLDAGCSSGSRQQTLPGSSEAHQASNNQLTGPASEVQGPPRSPTWGQTDSATVSGSQSEQVHSDHARSDHASGPDSDSESVKEGRLNARPPSSADGTVDLYVQSASSASPASGSAGAQGAEEAERARQQARMERNRESAHHSRQRKKMQLHEAEQRCQELQTQNNHLTGLVSRLTAENAALHHHLAAVCQRTGTPLPGPVMPPVLAPGMQPGMMRPPFGPYGPPMGMPLPPHVLMGQTPKVPIQKLKPSRPAAPEKRKAGKPDAGTSSSDSAGLPTSVPTSQAPEGRGRKRARTAAGASTALLALCCFFVFMGPMGPAIPGIGNTGGGLGLEYAALPGAPVRAGGRVLTALDMLPDNDTASSEVAVSTIPGGQLDILWQPDTNLTGVGVQVNDRGAEALALQRLKDLAPVALFSDWGPGLASRHWKDFPQLADSILASDHFASPLVCEERFRFDASAVADPAAVRRQLQRYLGTMQTFRGRAVSGAMPLPPIGHMEEEARAFQDVDPDEPKPKATIGCSQKEDDEEDAEAIVSVMLPTKQLAGSADAYFTSLDQLYVVVLKPRKQYTTYACTLPKPILV